MPHRSQRHAIHPYSGKRPHARRAPFHAHHSDGASAESARLRAASVARLIAAERVLPANPDAAALLLDGALSQMLQQWAQGARLPSGGGAAALCALDQHASAIAWRLRLALQAPGPEARLAHCWALLELLTSPTSAQTRGDATVIRNTHDPRLHHYQPRKDDQSHVS